MEKVSCIIPAHNEAERIGGVLQAVAGHPLIGEIIVVDDASEDKTNEAAVAFSGVRLIRHKENKGKSFSVGEGIAAAKEKFVLLLDADLLGLRREDVTNLVEPVISGRADMTISLRKHTPWQWHVIGLDPLSGERAFPKSFIEPHLETIKNLPSFGLETYLNSLLIKLKARIKVVFLPEVESPLKLKKSGFWRGLKEELRMRLQIIRTVNPLRRYFQILRMLFLKVK